jgi:hypothetical protein
MESLYHCLRLQVCSLALSGINSHSGCGAYHFACLFACLRFGGSLNVNLHFHVVFLAGVSLDRTEAGLKPHFVKAEPPSNANIAKILQTISHWVIRKLRRLGYLEAGREVAVATGDDPLLDNEPELARTMAASVMQRIAFGERAGEKVHHIGSGAALDGVLGLSSGQDDILGYLVDADRVGAGRFLLRRLHRFEVNGAGSACAHRPTTSAGYCHTAAT